MVIVVWVITGAIVTYLVVLALLSVIQTRRITRDVAHWWWKQEKLWRGRPSGIDFALWEQELSDNHPVEPDPPEQVLNPVSVCGE